MPYNLIEEDWIPIRRADGSEERIAPWRVTEDHADPQRRIIGLAAPRPDFNGALIQFLIGLVQTAMPPKDNAEWRASLRTPPSPETLHTAFKSVTHAFNLDGDGPRFMQDYSLLSSGDEPTDVSVLLIDFPGQQTGKHNKDLFVKRGVVRIMCYPCTATVLFVLQTNAPSGGQGHRTSLRGGGPLTTILTSATLWQTVAMNMMTRSELERSCANPELRDDDAIFPWLSTTRTSEKNGGVETTPHDCHPLQMYWAMPRRIRINFQGGQNRHCDLCGSRGVVVESFVAKNYGINYGGAWRHPLSPYGKDKDGSPFPLHPHQGGITYRHWPSYTHGDESTRITPATVVHAFSTRFVNAPEHRMWTFGYEMDNMKAHAWHEASWPYLSVVADEQRKLFASRVTMLCDTADEICRNLKKAVNKALLSAHCEASGSSLTDAASAEFWHVTEPAFYKTARLIADTLADQASPHALYEEWLAALNKASCTVFDNRVNSAMIEYMDIKRAVLARNDLLRYNNSKKIREKILHLPSGQTRTARKKHE